MLRTFTLLVALQAPVQDPLELTADLVLVDGKVATMEEAGDFAQAVAVSSTTRGASRAAF